MIACLTCAVNGKHLQCFFPRAGKLTDATQLKRHLRVDVVERGFQSNGPSNRPPFNQLRLPHLTSRELGEGSNRGLSNSSPRCARDERWQLSSRRLNAAVTCKIGPVSAYYMHAQAKVVAVEVGMASRAHGKLCRTPHAHESHAPGTHSPAAHEGGWLAADRAPAWSVGDRGQTGD